MVRRYDDLANRDGEDAADHWLHCWCRRAAQAAKAAREAARDAQNQLEIEAGAPGLFAFINTRLGAGATSSPAAPDQAEQRPGAPSGRCGVILCLAGSCASLYGGLRPAKGTVCGRPVRHGHNEPALSGLHRLYRARQVGRH